MFWIKTPLLQELVYDFLEEQKRLYPGAYERDKYSARNILRAKMSHLRITEFTEAHWQEYVHSVPEEKKLFNERRVLKKILNQIKRQPKLCSRMKELPKLYLEPRHFQSSQGASIHPEELEEIFRLIKTYEPSLALKWETIIKLACMCGLRRSEISGLRWNQIDFRTSHIIFEVGTTKDKNDREFYLTPEIVNNLNEIKKRSFSEFVFPKQRDPNCPMAGEAIYSRWKLILKQTNLPKYRFHDLRHSAITRLVESNKFSLTQISKALGVSPKLIEQCYYHVQTKTRHDMAEVLSGKPENVEPGA